MRGAERVGKKGSNLLHIKSYIINKKEIQRLFIVPIKDFQKISSLLGLDLDYPGIKAIL